MTGFKRNTRTAFSLTGMVHAHACAYSQRNKMKGAMELIFLRGGALGEGSPKCQNSTRDLDIDLKMMSKFRGYEISIGHIPDISQCRIKLFGVPRTAVLNICE